MIEITDLCVKLGDKQIFQNYSERLPDHGIILISGESGIGKTTLLRVLCGLLKPDHGTVTGLNGRKISFVFQEPRLLNYMTALQNAAIVSDEQKADDLLQRLNMQDAKHVKAGDLSGGQKQRISLARAFAFSDDVVLLDEPFTGLDEQNKLCATHLIRTANLAIVVSHDPSDADLLQIDRKITL